MTALLSRGCCTSLLHRLHTSTLSGVPENESALFVPLRSNASTLLTGRPIVAMRRRLKYASVFYDRLYLEAGILHLQAGPNGGVNFVEPSTDQRPARWQTPRQRHLAEQQEFLWLAASEHTPGVPAETAQVIIQSDTTVCWDATLEPFASEFPSNGGWVDFVTTQKPSGEIGRLADRWRWADQSNRSLEQAIPVRHVRSAIIDNANRDLVIGAASGTAVAIDPIHLQVVAQRFRDDGQWCARGYAVPLLFPQVGDLSWETIAELRCEPNVARFRAVLREVEQEAAAEASGGDIEAAAHHAYERHLANAADRLEGIAAPARRAVTGFVIGSGLGIATSGITGPLGILAGSAAGTAASAVVDVVKVVKRHRTRGWISVHQRIDGLAG